MPASCSSEAPSCQVGNPSWQPCTNVRPANERATSAPSFGGDDRPMTPHAALWLPGRSPTPRDASSSCSTRHRTRRSSNTESRSCSHGSTISYHPRDPSAEGKCRRTTPTTLLVIQRTSSWTTSLRKILGLKRWFDAPDTRVHVHVDSTVTLVPRLVSEWTP